MVKILCFGDSNTWGAVPSEMRRYDASERWPSILRNYLPSHCEIIEEGQAGRTVAHNDPAEQERNALAYLQPCLEKHTPDLVVFLLGTNDLKKRFALSATDISEGVSVLVEQTLTFVDSMSNTSPRVLLIAPPPIYEVGAFKRMFAGGALKSLALAKLYQETANKLGCSFFDAGLIVKSCAKEGIHWQADQHQLLADALAPRIKQLLIDDQLVANAEIRKVK